MEPIQFKNNFLVLFLYCYLSDPEKFPDQFFDFIFI